jgi:hypothetical protein
MGQSTDQFAARRHVKSASVISRLCRTGHYFGIRPRKLENGRLDWPDDKPTTAEGSATATDEQAEV